MLNRLFNKYLLLLLFTFSLQGKVILWDLGGVLVWPDKMKIAQTVGISNFLKYTLLDWKSPNIQELIFEVLEFMETPTPKVKEKNKAGTSEGFDFPPIMCHWQDGSITGPEIIKRSKPLIEKLNKLNFFESKRERILIQRTICSMFDPEILGNNFYFLEKGVELVKECKSARDKDGKAHKNFIFSNFDPLSFDILKKNYPEFFKLFDEIIISGYIGLIKPRDEFYRYFFEKYDIDPNECILVDDQEVNIACGKKHGIAGILLKKSDFKSVRKELIGHGVLPEKKIAKK